MGVYGKRLTFGAGCWRNSSTLSPDAFVIFQPQRFPFVSSFKFWVHIAAQKEPGNRRSGSTLKLVLHLSPLSLLSCTLTHLSHKWPNTLPELRFLLLFQMVRNGRMRDLRGLFGFRIIKQEDEKMWRSRKNAYAVEAAAPEVGPDLSLAENELDNAAFVSWSKGEIPTQIGGGLRWIPSSHRPSQISRRLLYG